MERHLSSTEAVSIELPHNEPWDYLPHRGQVAIAGIYNPETPAPLSCALHWHEFLELVFLEEGSAETFIGQAKHRIQPGDLIFINPNEPHSFQATDNTYFGVVQLKLDLLAAGQGKSDQIAVLFAAGQLLPNIIRHDAPHAGRWREQLQAIIQEIQTGDKLATLQAIALAFSLIVDVVRTYHPVLPTSTPSPQRDIERLYALQHFVRTHYAEEITLSDAAEALHVSRPHLCRLLQKWTGRSFFTYVREYRIHQAQHLLRTTALPITTIALEVGYTSPTAFDRAFSAITGTTPRAYRQGSVPTVQ